MLVWTPLIHVEEDFPIDYAEGTNYNYFISYNINDYHFLVTCYHHNDPQHKITILGTYLIRLQAQQACEDHDKKYRKINDEEEDC